MGRSSLLSTSSRVQTHVVQPNGGVAQRATSGQLLVPGRQAGSRAYRARRSSVGRGHQVGSCGIESVQSGHLWSSSSCPNHQPRPQITQSLGRSSSVCAEVVGVESHTVSSAAMLVHSQPLPRQAAPGGAGGCRPRPAAAPGARCSATCHLVMRTRTAPGLQEDAFRRRGRAWAEGAAAAQGTRAGGLMP